MCALRLSLLYGSIRHCSRSTTVMVGGELLQSPKFRQDGFGPTVKRDNVWLSPIALPQNTQLCKYITALYLAGAVGDSLRQASRPVRDPLVLARTGWKKSIRRTWPSKSSRKQTFLEMSNACRRSRRANKLHQRRRSTSFSIDLKS